ncbi:sulfotransferase [Vibrio kanaloae]|uniref:sulfotransferase family protein n=2 Tax=Vibrio kanaloae TaxID=170673 RepID=UPI0010BE8394|nr:sulfotransferase [Vibrio kanaloae]TKE98684.1 sulfotransferase [Vibrio kanaloae]
MNLPSLEHFFIIGSPRSGTSMFRLMLNSHPDVIVPPESGFAHWLSDKYSALPLDNTEILKNFAEDTINSRKFETWGLSHKELEFYFNEYQVSTYEQLCQLVYYAYAQEKNKNIRLTGDKNNYYIKHIESLQNKFPSAKFLLLVRDVKDVVCSCLDLHEKKINSIYKPEFSSSIKDIAIEWNEDNLEASKLLSNNICVVRYEDLITNPEEELIKVCTYLDIKYSSNMIKYYMNNDEPEEFLQWKKKTLEAPDSNNMNKYISKLSYDEIILINDVASEALSLFNYNR